MSTKIRNILGSVLAVYIFISGIVLIKSSAVIMGEYLAETIILLIKDTTSGVFAGWIGTARLHSSGAFDSIVVAFTSSGVLPISLAVATIIGAEIGTTNTPFLVSVLGHIRKKSRLTASFNVTLSHVLYNLFTLLIFYPAELLTGVFSKIAQQGSSIFVRATWLKAVPDLIDVATPWIDPLLKLIPPWTGLVIGSAALIIALIGLENNMTAIFSIPTSWNLIRATFTKPLRAFVAGFLFTILVPSTTVMISLLVPLAGSGVILADYYILPYILGANIGTVFDVMIAALATGDPVSLGVWLVHLTINLTGALIFLPLLKPFSSLVRWSAERIAESRRLTLVVTIIFHAIPVLVILGYVI
ncbi:MAG: Na/Pi cotransporter family protein [Candidatus Bathyarchaeota archaeon]|nr:MAG: Na/Pi cotransporter family protein [Candidatus Bathyarchaeota archaeon]